MKAILFRLRRARGAIVAVAAAAGLVIGLGAAPALAAGPLVTQFCQTSNGGYCLNDWNGGGGGNSVKMYQAGVGNERFVAQPVPRCGGKVTSSCPFSNSGFASRYAGFPIVQLLFQSDGLCVATNSSANPVLGTCNSTSTGDGGANGTLFVDHDGFLINVYWSNKDEHGSSASCMSGAASNGGSVNLNLATGSGCPVWNYGLDESTNYDWARWILHDGGWPESANNVTVLTEWMASEEPPSDWYNRDNPLNNGFGCGGGSGLGSCPNLFAAAQYVVDNLTQNPGFYQAIVNDLRASDSPSTTAHAICASPWASSHYNNCSAFFMGTAGTFAAPAGDW